uniref:Reticulon n=1 Tax=Taeniopygia guttata TaxID=59729 RepID=H0Z9R5_TAEGU|nr:reticulon-4 isoform X1 [Taeniopygia guttata]
MDELDQSPLVSSSSGPARPQQPQFNYQFVLDDEKEEEEEEEEDDDEDFDEQLEVMERKPAAAPAAAPQERPPQLLDLGGPAEPPRPTAPEPPQPDWSPRGAVSSSSSSATTPSPAQEQIPAPARPAQPQPPKPEPAVAPRSRGSSSGSADETLFALPATSAPLMHSSAEKVMDFQEQPGSTKSLGQEDFTAVPLDPAPSLPSFSPLSADPFKEHAAFGTLSDGFPARGTYKESSSEVYKEPMKNARNPFLAEGNDKDISEIKYSQPPFAKEAAAILCPAKEKTQLEGPEELPNLEKTLAQQLKMSPESPQDLFERSEEDHFCNKDKYRGGSDHGEKGVLKEDPLRREEYADFKPFEPIWEVKGASHGLSSMREDVGSKTDAKLESSLDDKYGVDKLTVQDYERESEGSAEEPSFPSTPEAVKEPSQTYITCTKFDSSPRPGNNKGKSLSPLEEGASENRTDDEKKIAELKAQMGPEQGNFAAGAVGQGADPAKAQGVPPVPPESAASMPEGLTPDLVQEAYEMHDAVCTKLAYETKIDLVQTSEVAQETLKPAAQICPSFEGSEAAPSPILPDIVMEAPLSTGTAGAEASAVQLEASPLETFMPTAKYENVKEAEKPPVFQEAVNVPPTQSQEAKDTLAFKQPDGESSTTPEDLETPYISIACDLIKGTKVSGESPPSFTEYSKTPVTESISQDVPEDKELDGTLSPQFGKASLFNSQMISDFAEEASEDPSLLLKSKSAESIATDEEDEEEGLVESAAVTGKPYLESFQPELDSSKIVATPPSEPIPAGIAKADKIPLQMEELDALAYSADVSVAMEPKTGDGKALSPMESSPVSVEEDFVMLGHPKAVPEFVIEATDRETMHKDEGEDISKVIQGEKQLPCPELPCDLSLKNVQVKAEEDSNALKKSLEAVGREVPEVSTMSLPATDTSPLSAEKEIVSVVKPGSFEKEAEKEAASIKEKKKPTAVFSAKLNKSSVVDLLFWRDIKKTGVVFGASLFLLLSLTVFSIVSVTAYIALALLSVTISFRIYKGVIQAIQKSDEGHPFRAYLDSDVAVSEELIQKYSNVVLGHVNGTVRELRRLFLVDDLVDSLKFAVLMWFFTYVGALFNGLTLLILALISLFSVPVIYERHQAQIDHYLGLVNKNVKDAMAKIQAKIPGLKRKTE